METEREKPQGEAPFLLPLARNANPIAPRDWQQDRSMSFSEDPASKLLPLLAMAVRSISVVIEVMLKQT